MATRTLRLPTKDVDLFGDLRQSVLELESDHTMRKGEEFCRKLRHEWTGFFAAYDEKKKGMLTALDELARITNDGIAELRLVPHSNNEDLIRLTNWMKSCSDRRMYMRVLKENGASATKAIIDSHSDEIRPSSLSE